MKRSHRLGGLGVVAALSLASACGPGAYEIWYASDRVKGVVFASIPITVT